MKTWLITATTLMALLTSSQAMAQGGNLPLTGGFQKMCDLGAGAQPSTQDAVACAAAAQNNGKPTYSIGCQKGPLVMMVLPRPFADPRMPLTSSEISKKPENRGRWAEEYGSCALAWGQK